MFTLHTILIIFVLIAAKRVESQNITITPSNATTIIVFNINRPLVLSCNLTLPEINATQQIKWYKNGTAVEELEELQDRHQVIPDEQLLIIERSHLEDHGEYTCSLNTTLDVLEQSFTAVANVAARLTKNTQLIEGENLWLHCRVTGTDPVVHWLLPDGQTLITNSTERIQLFEMDGVPNSALEILDIRLDERGNYSCIVSNLGEGFQGYEPAAAYGMVRVRSHLAPLWPVCGMAVEFFVLFVILYLYEKYRDPEDVDDDSVCDMPQRKRD
ncbi:basigin-like [Phlebotomus argentipes]|uniref:basigin-like n=1 Tax=Phlebotomus argentipes TaxID=94469 RepID=UPI0028932AB0|nr:basigin-like [Phlebotomus argentipes]